MSCLPHMPCYSVTTSFPSACSSCNNNNVNSDLVIYTGANLACSGINTCDTLTTSIQKLDEKICETQEGVLAINGVNRSGNFIKLGGPLTEATVITTTSANTLSILNLETDNIPQYLVSLSNGILRKTTYQTILNFLTADNGITKTLNNFRLGGTLVVPTTIATDAVNTLSITGLVTNPAPDFVLTETTAGVVQRTALSSIVPTPVNITADNGLTKTANNIQLGGTLIIPTTIATSSTNTLSITGLNTITTLPDFILTENSAQVVEKVDPQEILDAAAALITANNGLTKTISNVIQLGGSLLANTTVPISGYTLTFRDSASSGTGMDINCSTSVSAGGFPRNNFYGRNFFENHVGIRTYPDGSSGATTDIPLKVEKAGQFVPLDAFVAGTDSVLSMVTPGIGISGTRIYAGGVDRMYYNVQGNQTLAPLSIFSGHLAYFQYLSPNTTSGPTLQVANCSASAAQAYFTSGGTLDRIIAYRAMNPISDPISPFVGTITEVVGVQIEDQRSDTLLQPRIGSGGTYGIKQLGASDRNYFNGTFQIPSTNLSMGTATLVAGTVTVATTAVKIGSRIFLSVNTPGGTQGFLSAPSASIINNSSFVINSTNAADTSTVNWWVINS